MNPRSSVKSLRVLYTNPSDDYSFNPNSTDNGYSGHTEFDFGKKRYSTEDEETVEFGNSTSSLFSDSPSINEMRSVVTNMQQRQRLPEAEPQPEPMRKPRHVYAPPGKVGVAIDVVNGHPIVHKVKRGSPLEGLLHPRDWVIAIDDVDTTSMSAADVTSLMVKRMNYNRKITVMRGDVGFT